MTQHHPLISANPASSRRSFSLRIRLLSLIACALFLVGLGATSAARAQYHEGGGGGRSSGGSGIGGAAVGIGIGIGVGIIANEAAKAAERERAKKKKPKPKVTRTTRKRPPKKRQAKKAPARAPAPVAIPDFASGEILLAFAPNASDADVTQFVLEYGLRPVSNTTIAILNQRILRATIPGGLAPERALQISNDPRVIVQPNYLYVPAADDAPQYALAKLGVPQAHQTTQGQGVLVAVIDSGIDSSHPALVGAVLEEFSAVDAKAKSDSSHGTAVASIIAARKGMTSVAPQAQILSVKTFARDRKLGRIVANTFDILKGIDYAVTKGAKILNLSFAGPRDPLMQNALSVAVGRGLVVVAAAGNKGPKAPPAYPGAYSDVIAATATDARDKLYKNANRGSYIAIAAPGVDVLAAGRKKGYGLNSGTSMAAAYVSGSVALMLQTSPGLNSARAVERLAASARDLGDSGKDSDYGYGLIDIAKAINGK